MEQLLKTCLRELESKLGGQRFDDDEDQVAAEGDGKAAAPGAAPEECICVDMDFAENYEIVHKVEIQSEHWQHQQVTLYIVIAHFKKNGVWTSEAHIFCSADRGHDTYFVQRAMQGL